MKAEKGYDPADVEEAKKQAWASTTTRYPWKYEEFLVTTKDWVFHPVKGGAIATHGPEIHAVVFPNSLDKRAKLILNEVLKEYGYAITSTTLGNEIGESFVAKRGFYKTHIVGDVQYWRLDNHGT